jgi:hypothetical protein
MKRVTIYVLLVVFCIVAFHSISEACTMYFSGYWPNPRDLRVFAYPSTRHFLNDIQPSAGIISPAKSTSLLSLTGLLQSPPTKSEL